MGNSKSSTTAPTTPDSKLKCEGDSCKMEKKSEETNKDESKKLKPCCACPETKKIRDTW